MAAKALENFPSGWACDMFVCGVSDSGCNFGFEREFFSEEHAKNGQALNSLNFDWNYSDDGGPISLSI